MNCLTEVLFDSAVKDADRLDELFSANGKLVGPLHGIPVTLKDQFDVKGVDSTIGYVSRAYQPAEEDGVIVKILRDLGAVIIAKTNLPQSIMVRNTAVWKLVEQKADSDAVVRNRMSFMGPNDQPPQP